MCHIIYLYPVLEPSEYETGYKYMIWHIDEKLF